MLDDWNKNESDEAKLVKIGKAVRNALKNAGMEGRDAFVVMPVEKSSRGQSCDIIGFSGTLNAVNMWHIDVPLGSVLEKLQEINPNDAPVFQSGIHAGRKRFLRLVDNELSPRSIKHADGSEHKIEEEY